MRRHRDSVLLGQRHHARSFGIEGDITFGEWYAVQLRYGNICLVCGANENLAPDHVVPLSRGGTNTIDNIQPLCRHCNLVKQNKTIDYRPGRAIREVASDDIPLYIDDGLEHLRLSMPTYKSIRLIAALTGEKIMDVCERMVELELKRLSEEGQYIPQKTVKNP